MAVGRNVVAPHTGKQYSRCRQMKALHTLRHVEAFSVRPNRWVALRRPVILHMMLLICAVHEREDETVTPSNNSLSTN